MLRILQRMSHAIGLLLLFFMGLDASESKRVAPRDVLLAFALLACILLFLTESLCTELDLRWPLLLVVCFLTLLGSALFTRRDK